MKRAIPIVALACAAASLGAQGAAPAPRQLGPTVATSTEMFGPLVFTRHTKNGVLVNDIANRRLVLLDGSLALSKVVADSTPAPANARSGRSAGLINYKADSSLFVDPGSLSMLVLDGSGNVARVMSVPRSQDAMVLGNTALGTPSYDGKGRLVYRGFGMPRFEMRRSENGSMIPAPPDFPDSAAVLRVDLATRAVDTVAFVKVPKVKMDIQRDDNGNVRMSAQMNPLPVIDDWAVLSDGSVAVVRGRDYHMEFVRPDGSKESAAKMPFEWQRMTDEDKVAFIDSLKAARARLAANAPTPMVGGGPGGGVAAGGGGPEGDRRQSRTEVIIGGGPGGPARAGMAMGGRNELNFVGPSELPDYKPPFFAGSIRADEDGHLWIRTIPTKGTTGGPIYDVVSVKGELVERVQVPKDRMIVGFGTGGVVYLLHTDGTTRTLERAQYK